MSKSQKGKILSVETKRKIGDSHRGRKLTEEHKKKLGGKFSEEHIRNLILSRMGEKNHFFGRKHSEETKEKMREIAMGKLPSERKKKNRKEIYDRP